MNTQRLTVVFVTVFTVACGLVLGGFASPASAETIVVTTLADTTDPPAPVLPLKISAKSANNPAPQH